MGRSIALLTDTGTEAAAVGGKCRADSYYGFTDGLHTVAIYAQGFTGRVLIEGTLVADPCEPKPAMTDAEGRETPADPGDWFPVHLGDGADPHIEFSAATETVARTFYGNFLYLRARIENRTAGKVARILLNH